MLTTLPTLYILKKNLIGYKGKVDHWLTAWFVGILSARICRKKFQSDRNISNNLDIKTLKLPR